MNHTMPRRFCTSEAAEFLGIKSQTLKNWVQANSCPSYYKVGGKLVFDRDELTEWMADRRVTPARNHIEPEQVSA